MSRATTPTPSNSAATQESKYTLRVIKAELNEVLKKKTAVYVEIKLPSLAPVLTQTAEAPKLEWNRKIDFTSLRNFRIRVKLSKKEPILSDTCLGEGSVTIGDLHDHCQEDQGTLRFFPKNTGADCGADYSLVLVNPRNRKSIGTLLIQLRIKAETGRFTHDVTGSRKLVETMRSKISDTLGIDYPISAHSPSSSVNAVSTTGENSQPDGFETLSRVRNQLESMNSGKHRMALSVIDAASKAYEEKPRIDSEVVKVFVSIDHIFSFVEDVDKLKDQSHRFFNLIEESLHIIESCGNFILEYLHGSTKDQMQLALSKGERLDHYEKELRSRAEDLGRIVNVHVAHRMDENHKEVMEALGRNGKPVNSQSFLIDSSQSIIPPPPAEMFTGRDDYLRKMETIFQLPKTSVEIRKQRKYVLYGTGGMGKTQLALKFLDENSERFTLRYIIDASSHETIASSFANVGHDAGIPNPNTLKVLNWLREKIEDWILIFDNADNRDVKLRPYFPNCHHGNILITTRNADYQSFADSLEVSVLDNPTSISLLLRTARLEETEENSKTAQKIVGEFGNLALAIVQAGSYVHTQRLTLHEYYERYERSRSSLLKSGPLKEELAYEQPVYATWEVSYAALTEFAKTILNVCAFLYREGITEELWLRAAKSEKAKLAKETGADDATAPKTLLSLFQYLDEDSIGEYIERFRELVRELRSYSLIQEPFKGSLSIHPLVHTWARDRMHRMPSDYLEAQTNAIHVLHFSLPSTSIYRLYLDSSFARMIVPHIESCGGTLQADIALEFAIVYALSGKENYPRARELLTVALSQRQLYEPDKLETYNSRIYLGALYSWLNRFSEAAEVLGTLVEEQRMVLGNDHCLTLDSLFELAVAFEHQGLLADAQDLFIEVIEAKKRVLGNEHSDILYIMHELALTYQHQGKLDDAQQLFTKVVEANKRVLGNDHSQTLNSIHELAKIYQDQEQLDVAQQLFTEVVEARKQVLGNHHSDTLNSMYGLALTYQYQGQVDNAQELFAEVVEARKQVLGNNHSQTLVSMHALASTYRDQGQLDNAQELFAEVVEARKQVLGNNHSQTLISMYELALTYDYQGQLDNAQQLFAKVVEASKQVFGNDHSQTLVSMYALALTYKDQGQLDNAQELFAEVVKAGKQVFGNNHTLILRSMHALAKIYQDQEQLDNAQDLFAEVVEAKKQVFGNHHSSTLKSMHALAKIYQYQGQLDNAQELFAKVVEAKKQVFGNDHSDTLNSMHALAKIYRGQGQLDNAQELFAEVVEAKKQLFGNHHSSTLKSMHALAKTYQDQGQLDDAQELFAEVVKVGKQVLGNEHPVTLDSIHDLTKIYHAQRQFDHAAALGLDSYELHKQVFGPSDYWTILSRKLLADIYTQQGHLGDAGRLKTLNSILV